MSRIKNLREDALAMHKNFQGKIEVRVKVPVRDADDLTLAYSPGVAEPCMEINRNPEMLDVYTNHGNFVCVVSNGTAVSASLFRSLPYDTLADFAPVSTLGFFDIAVLVPADSPHATLAQLLAHARARPGQLNIGSINIGSTQHLAAELFKSSAAIDAQVVPFNGTPALITALRGRQVDVGVEILGPTLPQVRAGALRVLAVTGEQRSAVLPDVPTAVELGVQGFVATSWNALAAPARTPRPVVERLQREVVATVATPAVQQQLRALNVEPRTSTPGQAAALLKTDIERWRAVIERAGIPRQ